MSRGRYGDATLVDLLDRVLEKGVVLKTDVIITVADVPLLGLNLTALLAGMTTFLEYGIWEDWDEAHRAWAREHEHRIASQQLLLPGEQVRHLSRASVRGDVGGSQSWRPGTLLLTDQRLICYRRQPFEVFTETAMNEISDMVHDDSDDRVITILARDGSDVTIRSVESSYLHDLIRSMIRGSGGDGGAEAGNGAR